MFTAGCAALPATERPLPPVVQTEWQRGGLDDLQTTDWLLEFDSESLPIGDLVADALANNYQLAQQAARVEQARQDVIAARAPRLPAFDLFFDASRRKSAGSDAISTSTQAGIDAGWEVDVWGRLSATQRAASLVLAAQESAYESARRQLAANVAQTLFDVAESRLLLTVFEQRLANASQGLDVVESGYRQGLNEALDLYLAQNSVEQEKANLAQQKQTVLESTGRLQRLLALYPDGSLEIGTDLPAVDTAVPVGMPSELLLRRADLRQAWFSLLAADATLAAAHRARFPRLTLSASAGRSSAELDDLLSANNLFWTAIASSTAPLFDAGRLKAQEARAAARARELEQQYLDLLYDAFAEVENAISRTRSLEEQFNALLLAQANAAAALDLALEQYQRGLVTYTTVLESQRRAFDATTTVVRLRNQRLQNRIALHLAVGGEFSM